jgi:hypothetical protein
MRGAMPRARWGALGALLLVQAALGSGCDQILGIEEASAPDATTPADGAGLPDSSGPDADTGHAPDSSPPMDAPRTDTASPMDSTTQMDSASPTDSTTPPDAMDATSPEDAPGATDALSCPNLGGASCEGGLCIVELAGGANFACALRADGTVWCWGSNQYGELGHPPGANDDVQCNVHNVDGGVPCQPVPTQVALPALATHVSAGNDFACAATSAGGVYCWGLNASDQVGHVAGVGDDECLSYGSGTSLPCNPNPQAVESQDGGSFVAEAGVQVLASGPLMTCALTGNEVVCWGEHIDDGLGASYGSNMASPVVVPFGGQGATQLAVSPSLDDGCAILGDAGQISCWGTNESQVIASNAVCDSACTPTPVVTDAGSPFGPALEVRLGQQFGCALLTDRSLWCWGSNGSQQLGVLNLSETHAVVPAVLWTMTGGAAPAEHIALSLDTTLILDCRGRVWAWGDDQFGVAANAMNFPTNTLVTDPQEVTLGDGAAPATLLATGSQSAFARTADNTVWAWGSNTYGQLGHSPGSDSDQPKGGQQQPSNPTPMAVPFPDE